MKTQTAFLSGEYRKWVRSRSVTPGHRGQNRITLLGLAQALDDPFRVKAKLRIDGKIVYGWKREGDRILLKEPLSQGVYNATFEITYSDMERAVYT